MTWSRFDDRWADRPVWETVDLAARWHYLCLVQSCSRNERYDGIVPLKLARRASDVDDPDECHAVLEAHSLIEIRGDELRIVEIDEHVPPPSIRNNAEASKVRMARMRKHKNGDHSECLAETCPKGEVTEVVTRNTGTGQDGLLQEPQVREDESVTRNTQNHKKPDDGAPSPSAASHSSAAFASDYTCPHGMKYGNTPDPWANNLPPCERCREERKVAS